MRLRAIALLSPAYLWLTVAIFLPLSAMLFFSFLSAAPFTNADWYLTFGNYAEFFSRSLYPDCWAALSCWRLSSRFFAY